MMMDNLLEMMIVAITFYLMLIVGLELQVKQLALQLHQIKPVIGGLLAQLILLPVLTLLLIKLTSPPIELGIGMLLVSLCPGGSVSNYYTLLARGDVAFSVSLTMASTLCCFISLPFIFNFISADFLLSSPIRLPFWETISQLIGLLIIPILLGMLIRKMFLNLTICLLPSARLTSILGLMFVVVVIVLSKKEYLINYLPVITQTALLFTLIALSCGAVTGYLLGLTSGQIIALGIEFPARNLAIATSISLTLLDLSNAILFTTAMFLLQFPVFMLIILSRLGMKKSQTSL